MSPSIGKNHAVIYCDQLWKAASWAEGRKDSNSLVRMSHHISPHYFYIKNVAILHITKKSQTSSASGENQVQNMGGPFLQSALPMDFAMVPPSVPPQSFLVVNRNIDLRSSSQLERSREYISSTSMHFQQPRTSRPERYSVPCLLHFLHINACQKREMRNDDASKGNNVDSISNSGCQNSRGIQRKS